MSNTSVETCANPGCSEPGTHKCSSCKTSHYCGPICQTAHWPTHKEECQGRLLKLGKANLVKADGFEQQRNFAQSLRFSESALNMLKKLTGRTIEVIKIMDDAMRIKFNALSFTDRRKEALECAQERYSLWAAGYMRHYGMLNAAFPLIDGLLHNKEYEQAVLIARTAYEMIINDIDNIIPDDLRQQFLADGAHHLARAIHQLAKSGGIPPEQKQKAGEEAISLIRKALEICTTQLHGSESAHLASNLAILAVILQYFNGVDDECIRLHEQTIAVFRRLEGNMSPNVAGNLNNLAVTYEQRAIKAFDANDLDRCLADLELALTHSREAVRIFRTINHSNASCCENFVAGIEERLIPIRIARI